jgi:hypothetical protein
LRGDIGGVGSDATWDAVATFDYTVSEKRTATLVLACRVLDVDCEQGLGADQFLFNLQIGGPVSGVIFCFE